MIIDKLYEDVKSKGNVCVGLDTDISYIPKKFLQKFNYVEDAIFRFNQRIIDATSDIASCYKVQIAYYEALGINGLLVYKKTLDYIKEKGIVSIADIKRGDIANTAKMYAKAHFEGDFESDIITLNPYMGMDSLEPYMPYIEKKNKGVFLLLRTSNKGSKDIQHLILEDKKKVYDSVGEKIKATGDKILGKSGYSSIGAVVGCTSNEEAKMLREKYDKTFFLIPGYGAQGGKAETARAYLNKGNGGVVNSSRGILLAYKNHDEEGKNFEEYARLEAINMRNNLSM
ncbi:orotidine-5'-phosphate decarboxylase [Clostridium oceanicum]|uniref:Orotidine 5'-phosphate decarboxylase n=1 Tax=Clostridium oceanicum TaxID=1543 RepID=A0ABP3V9E3_9CLOT